MWQYPDKPLELSEPAVPDEFMPPYNRTKLALTDYARGGVALLDATQGLNVKNWACEVQGAGVYISADDIPAVRVETLQGEPEWISFCFDQNMHYALVYRLSNGVFMYWYDADRQGYVTDSLGGNLKTPFLRMDDSRKHANIWNDMILSYIKGSSLFCRLQRDRFTIEYLLASSAGSSIIQCGMNRGYRFQWNCL